MKNQENKDKRIINENIDHLLGRVAPDSWIIMPRYLNALLRAGVITPTEYNVYTYLRNDCNQYGICITSVDNIINDIFPQNRKPAKNWVNKVLRSLLNKKLIKFKERKGVAGSFEVTFSDFLLPNGKYSSIDKSDNTRARSPIDISTDLITAYENADVESDSHYVEDTGKPVTTGKIDIRRVGTLAGTNTDKDIENYTTVSVSNKTEGLVLVTDFRPSNHDEFTALEIAKFAEDQHINWYLSLIANNQLWVLEKAFGELKEDLLTNTIHNKGAYLNGIVQRMLKNQLLDTMSKKL